MIKENIIKIIKRFSPKKKTDQTKPSDDKKQYMHKEITASGSSTADSNQDTQRPLSLSRPNSKEDLSESDTKTPPPSRSGSTVDLSGYNIPQSPSGRGSTVDLSGYNTPQPPSSRRGSIETFSGHDTTQSPSGRGSIVDSSGYNTPQPPSSRRGSIVDFSIDDTKKSSSILYSNFIAQYLAWFLTGNPNKPGLTVTKTDLNFKNNEGNKSLHLAVNKGNTKLIHKLILEGSDVNAKNNEGDTPLHLAVNKGDTKLINHLISSGSDVNAKNNEGNTPLHLAVNKGDTELINYLISKGSDVNAKNNEGNTPLHLAVNKGDTELINYLISEGSDVNAKNNKGYTAFVEAVLLFNNYPKMKGDLIVDYFILIGAQTDQKLVQGLKELPDNLKIKIKASFYNKTISKNLVGTLLAKLIDPIIYYIEDVINNKNNNLSFYEYYSKYINITSFLEFVCYNFSFGFAYKNGFGYLNSVIVSKGLTDLFNVIISGEYDLKSYSFKNVQNYSNDFLIDIFNTSLIYILCIFSKNINDLVFVDKNFYIEEQGLLVSTLVNMLPALTNLALSISYQTGNLIYKTYIKKNNESDINNQHDTEQKNIMILSNNSASPEIILTDNENHDTNHNKEQRNIMMLANDSASTEKVLTDNEGHKTNFVYDLFKYWIDY